jgi:GT2 family glycosyltransferase
MTSEIESRKNLDTLHKLFTFYKKDEISLLKFIQLIELIRYFLGPDNELEYKIKNSGISRIIDVPDFYFFHKECDTSSEEFRLDSEIFLLIIKSIKKCHEVFNTKFHAYTLQNKIK